MRVNAASLARSVTSSSAPPAKKSYTGRGSLPCAWSSRARRGTVCMGLLDSGDRGRGAPVCDAREELAQRRPVRRAVPLVLEIFGDVVLGNKLAACEKSHHR